MPQAHVKSQEGDLTNKLLKGDTLIRWWNVLKRKLNISIL